MVMMAWVNSLLHGYLNQCVNNHFIKGLQVLCYLFFVIRMQGLTCLAFQ